MYGERRPNTRTKSVHFLVRNEDCASDELQRRGHFSTKNQNRGHMTFFPSLRTGLLEIVYITILLKMRTSIILC